MQTIFKNILKTIKITLTIQLYHNKIKIYYPIITIYKNLINKTPLKKNL